MPISLVINSIIIKNILLLILILSFFSLSAQDMTIDQTLQYINDKLNSQGTVEIFTVYQGELSGTDYTYSGVALTDKGEITFHESVFWHKYHTYNNTDYFFSTRDVHEEFDTGGISTESYAGNNLVHQPYVNFICNNNASKSLCVNFTENPMLRSSNGKGNCVATSISFNDRIICQSVFNAFKHLMKKINSDPNYLRKQAEYDPFAPTNNSTYPKQELHVNSKSIIVQMVKNSGDTYEIPVELNNVLKINFIFDSGASDCSISSDVALTLIKTGTVKQSDFIGSHRYQFADGSIAISKVFILHEVKIGTKTLRNIRTSISDSNDAPMLLGQSVLKQFGKFTIDNTYHTLTIE
jgi:predicted aspartyl protease